MMFKDLMTKLKSSIEELRKKLPGGNKEVDIEEDDDFEEKYYSDDEIGEEEKTVKVQIKDIIEEDADKTQKMESDEDNDDDDDENDEEEEDEDEEELSKEKAEKRKKIVIFAGVLTIVVVLGYDYVIPPEPEIPPPIKRQKRVRPKKQAIENNQVNVPAAEEQVQPTIENKVDTQSNTEAQTEVQEDKPVLDVPPETATGLPSEQNDSTTDTAIGDNDSVQEPIKINEETQPEAPQMDEGEVAPSQDDTSVAAEQTEEVVPGEEETPDDSSTSEEEIAPKKEELEEKIGESDAETAPIENKKDTNESLPTLPEIKTKLEYVPPPNYERAGRGLVYNCVGGHWACTDKYSYITCRENSRWSVENKKKPECVIKNVYATPEDCGIIQRHYIESSEPTDFCKK